MFMRTFLFFLISLIVGIGLFSLTIYFLGWQTIKDVFAIISNWRGIVIFGLTILAFLIGNWRWGEILRAKDVSVPFFELFKSYLAGFSIMYLAPIILFGGEIFRAYSLKERNGVNWQKAASSVLIDRIIEFTLNVFIIFLGIIIFFSLNGFPSDKIVRIFLIGPIFLGLIIFIFYFKVFKKESLVKFFLKFLGLKYLNQNNGILDIEKETFDFFKMNRGLLLKVFFLSFLRSVLTYLRVLLIIFFLGVKINWLSAIAILGFSYLALLIPIPASLGSHELIQVSAFGYFGINLASAASFTIIIRSAELITAFIGIFFLFKLGIGILKGFMFKKLKLEKNYGN